MNFQEYFRPVVFWEKRGERGKKMRKGGARGPPAPQPGFAFAANPELNFRDVGEAEVREAPLRLASPLFGHCP